MKLFKLMATTAITTMAVAAMSVSASAAMTAKYVPATETETGKVTLATELTADQRTLLVLNNDVFGDFAENAVENASVSEGDIVQIDQDAAFGTVVVGDLQKAMDDANAVLLAAYENSDKSKDAYAALTKDWQASKTYYVRVGGAATIETASFDVETTAVLPGAEPEAPAYTYGDVDNNGTINATDAGWVLSKYANSSLELQVPDEYADVDANDTINATDAGWVLSKYANSSLVFPAEEAN